MAVEEVSGEHIGDDELLQTRRGDITTLLEERQLVDDLFGSGNDADPQAAGERLREGVDVDDQGVAIEAEERWRGWALEAQIAVGLVFEDRQTVAVGEVEEIAANAARQHLTGRILEGRIGVEQLGAVANQQILELIQIGPLDVPADDARAGGPEDLDRPEIARADP